MSNSKGFATFDGHAKRMCSSSQEGLDWSPSPFSPQEVLDWSPPPFLRSSVNQGWVVHGGASSVSWLVSPRQCNSAACCLPPCLLMYDTATTLRMQIWTSSEQEHCDTGKPNIQSSPNLTSIFLKRHLHIFPPSILCPLSKFSLVREIEDRSCWRGQWQVGTVNPTR